MTLGTAQEAFFHLAATRQTVKVSSARNALIDTMFLNSKLVDGLCK